MVASIYEFQRQQAPQLARRHPPHGRRRVDCDAELRVTTNGPLDVTLLGCDRTESFDGSGPGLESYDPVDPLAGVGNPVQGAPLPAEVGNAPQPPLAGLPPLRFPPNVGGDPSPSGG